MLLEELDRLVELTLLLAVLLLLDHQGVVLFVVCFEITLGGVKLIQIAIHLVLTLLNLALDLVSSSFDGANF